MKKIPSTMSPDQMKPIPMGNFHDRELVSASVPKLIQYATKIPRVMNSW